MRKKLFILLAAMAMLFVACGKQPKKHSDMGKTNDEMKLTDDSTIYGLACEGCNDSAVWLLPNDGSDPVRYSVLEAKRAGRVLGDIKTGDWIGLMRNPEDSTVADIVINLDELKGIWCYIVMPKLRDVHTLSQKSQEKFVDGMNDSLRRLYFVPREYGFWLKRQWEASSVGYVREVSSLVEESPVVYPPLGYFVKWHILNGKFVMTSGKPRYDKDNRVTGYDDVVNDTCTIDFLGHDSLVLSDRDGTRSYYRKKDISEVNKKAQEIAEKRTKEALQQTTGE